MRISRFLLAGAFGAALIAHGQDTPAEQPARPVNLRNRTGTASALETAATTPPSPAPVREQRVDSRGSVTIAGTPIAYTATAGTLTLRDAEGRPTASMFYVAYVANADKGAARPVTFFYNGGPGSSSLWLHLGAFGPRRILTDSPDATRGPPFRLVDNDQCLLDKTDLVFLDAVGTGYSRFLGEGKPETFWGVDQDISSFAHGIARYITLNHRWNSPKFLFGESYGTTRSAGLAYALADNGIQLNGVALLSSVLNYGWELPGSDWGYVAYLPSFAAIAAYHHKLAREPSDLPAFLNEVRAWAAGPYAAALMKGTDLSAEDEAAIARQLSAYTGLSVQYLEESRLRVSAARFRKELLRSEHRVLGRYDARFEGIDIDDAGEIPETDPAEAGIKGAFVGAINQYFETDLHYTSDMTYLPSGAGIITKWDWHHKRPNAQEGARPDALPDVALDLGTAMRRNPHLKLLSLNGWYDLATPFFKTEFDVKHMLLDPSLRGNVEFRYYPSGHMVYLNPDALKTMRADVGRWYDEVLR